jgi:hypothetical protein
MEAILKVEEKKELTFKEKVEACPFTPTDTDTIGEQFIPPSKIELILAHKGQFDAGKKGQAQQPKMFSPYLRVLKRGSGCPAWVKEGSLYLVSGAVQFLKLNDTEYIAAQYNVLTAEVDEDKVKNWW